MGSLSEVCKILWDHDKNRLKEGEDYKINLKGTNCKLFTFVNTSKLADIPTFNALISLLDKFESETSVLEQEKPEKSDNIQAFLDCCLETDVMQEALSFLLKKGLIPDPKVDHDAFKKLLYGLWFQLYPRPDEDRTERSAFEHVFVGETYTRKKSVLGFHNWVQLYEQESQGDLRYKGFKPTACDNRIITIDFTWKNSFKKVGSFFLGTSPEFELAIYTVCFLAGNKNETTVTLENKPAIIVTIHAGSQIKTCYPKLQGQPGLLEGRPDDVGIQVELEEEPSSDIRGRFKRGRPCWKCTIL